MNNENRLREEINPMKSVSVIFSVIISLTNERIQKSFSRWYEIIFCQKLLFINNETSPNQRDVD